MVDPTDRIPAVATSLDCDLDREMEDFGMFRLASIYTGYKFPWDGQQSDALDVSTAINLGSAPKAGAD